MKYDTIGRLIDGGFTLRAYCYAVHDGLACHHYAKIDLNALAARLGPDHGSMHGDLVPKLRCSKCGSKNVGLRLSPDTSPKFQGPVTWTHGIIVPRVAR